MNSYTDEDLNKLLWLSMFGFVIAFALLEAIKDMRNCCEDNPDGIIDVC